MGKSSYKTQLFTTCFHTMGDNDPLFHEIDTRLLKFATYVLCSAMLGDATDPGRAKINLPDAQRELVVLEPIWIEKKKTGEVGRI